MPRRSTSQKTTVTDDVLIAIYQMQTESSLKEVDEWSITERCWKNDPATFGMRGKEEIYPNHCVVLPKISMLISSKYESVGTGYLKRTRKNHYTITPLGISRVTKLLGTQDSYKQSPDVNLYDFLSNYVHNEVFKKYLVNPDEPRTWYGVAKFFKLYEMNSDNFIQTKGEIDEAIKLARAWFDDTGNNSFSRGARSKSKPITIESLQKLEKFIKVIMKRFQSKFNAVLNN